MDLDYSEAIEEIDDMLEDERYSFAHGTLEGIRDSIEEYQNVTYRQSDAIQNIRNSIPDKSN